MSPSKTILLEIEKSVKSEILNTTPLPKKATARNPHSYILEDAKHHKFILVCPDSVISRFYLNRELIFQKKFHDLQIPFLVNFPIIYKENFALYQYVEKQNHVYGLYPTLLGLKFLSKAAKKYTVNDFLIRLICYEFLSAWPIKHHKEIMQLSNYHLFREELSKYSHIWLVPEHGDFTSNNMLKTTEGIMLLDFEFSKMYQPIGFDLLDYCRSTNSFKNGFFYKKINKIKYSLIEEINSIIDASV